MTIPSRRNGHMVKLGKERLRKKQEIEEKKKSNENNWAGIN